MVDGVQLKQRFTNGYKLVGAAVEHDGKPIFLRKFAEWLLEWQTEKLPNSERFAPSAQTSSASIHTTKCQAALIEDLLREGYDYVLTTRFQSDPLEKRYSHYLQMSGGRLLVSIKDAMLSENILKIKSLVKEGFNIDPSLKEDGKCEEATAKLLEDVESTFPTLYS